MKGRASSREGGVKCMCLLINLSVRLSVCLSVCLWGRFGCPSPSRSRSSSTPFEGTVARATPLPSLRGLSVAGGW